MFSKSPLPFTLHTTVWGAFEASKCGFSVCPVEYNDHQLYPKLWGQNRCLICDLHFTISTVPGPGRYAKGLPGSLCQALEDTPRAPRFMVPSPGRYTKRIPGSRVEFASSLCVSTCSMGARGLLGAALHPSCLANY